MSFPRAEKILKQAIALAQRDNLLQLPSLTTLAENAQVSRMTMWKAIRALCEQDELLVRQGSGIFIKEKANENSMVFDLKKTPQSTYKWEHVKGSLLQDILTGRFRSSTQLPLTKELSRHYGVDSATMKKSLQSLVTKKNIRKDKTRYEILRTPLPAIGQSSIILILPDNLASLMQWSYYTQAIANFSALIEQECHRRSILLIRRNFSQARKEIRLLKDALGCIFWVGGNEAEANLFFQSIPYLDKPLAIVDYWAQFNLPSGNSNATRALVQSICEEDAMMQLAQYALNLGHRHIAYFRASPSTTWANFRMNGAQQAFKNAGIPLENLYVYDSRPSTIYPVPTLASQKSFDTLRTNVDKLVDNSTIKNMLISRLNESENYAELAQRSRDHFLFALTQREITAWICESESLAIYGALPILQAQKIQVPKQLSLMAFGNTPEAFSAGLTSTTERMDLCLEEIMRHILYPELRKKPIGRKQSIPNMVVVRETSGRYFL